LSGQQSALINRRSATRIEIVVRDELAAAKAAESMIFHSL
jgi:hypothetical protein